MAGSAVEDQAGPVAAGVPTDPVAAGIAAGYAFPGPALEFGSVVHGGVAHPGAQVRVPLSMVNRHGLIAGATGTGKTKTLQLLAEQLSGAGVPVVLADVKGDLSGLARPGEAGLRISTRAADTATTGPPPGTRWSSWHSAVWEPACRCAQPSRVSARSC